MSETIRFTITEQVQVFNIKFVQEPAIFINYAKLALPDSRVMEALQDVLAAKAEVLGILEQIDDLIVDTLAGGETDKVPSVAIVKSSIENLQEYIDNKFLGGLTEIIFGNPLSDGSFRLFFDGTDLKIQTKFGSDWITKDTISNS